MKIAFLFLLAISTLAFGEGHKNALLIKSSEYGVKWPFKGKEYSLGCITRSGRPFVYVSDVENGPHGINGAGRGVGKDLLGWPDGLILLKKGKLPLDLQIFIDKGLKLCD